MLFPAGSGLTSPPSPLLPTFHGCGFVPVHLLFPLFALEIRRGVVFCPCFSLYLPWRSEARECSRFPCAVPGAAGGVGWRRAARSGPARIRPCHSRWEFSVHAVKHLEAGLGRAGAGTGALGFHSAFPEREAPRMRALPCKGNALCGVLSPRGCWQT